MPIYEYECTECSAIFETLVSINSDEIIVCEKCGSKKTRKRISASVFKVSSSSDKPSSCQSRGGFS